LQKERLEKMENPRNETLAAIDIVVIFDIVVTLLSIVMGLSFWVVFESGFPFYIKLFFGFVFLFVVLFAIIIFVGFLIHVFRKKSKEK
jgi:membrane protein YdbS with pleckstrin-like domain